MSVFYHPGKANVVADAFSRMTMGTVPHINIGLKDLVKDAHRLARFDVQLDDSLNCSFMVYNNCELSLVVEVNS